MAGESDDLEKLFESVADGESVDWDKLERNAPDEDTRALIRQLRLIAEVAEVHRSQVDEVAPSDVELTAPAFGGLPPIQPSHARRVLPEGAVGAQPQLKTSNIRWRERRSAGLLPNAPTRRGERIRHTHPAFLGIE